MKAKMMKWRCPKCRGWLKVSHTKCAGYGNVFHPTYHRDGSEKEEQR